MSEVTRILNSDDSGSAEELLPLIYQELRRLAASKMAAQAPGQTIQATALVHEAWLKLTTQDRRWNDRKHFFAAAAEAMRQILIDRVRRKNAARRGGGQETLPIDAVEIRIENDTDQDTVLKVNDALDELEKADPVKAEVVKLRYFIGLNNQEIAEVLGVSTRTVERAWVFSRSWLFSHLGKDSKQS